MSIRHYIDLVESAGRESFADTPAFRAWFKDSKVVDEQGRPLRVFHGTPTGGFDVFSRDMRGTRTKHKAEDVGFHFSADPDTASTYSGAHNIEAHDIFHQMFGYSPAAVDVPPAATTYPVFLSIQNPMHLDRAIISAETISKAQRLGHDGIIGHDGNAKEFVVFRPDQIKSAVGNNGKFDPATLSITESALAEAGEERVWNDRYNETVGGWLERHGVEKQGAQYVFYHATPKRGGAKDVIRSRSYLSTDARLKRSAIDLHRLLLDVDDIQPGMFATLTRDVAISKATLMKGDATMLPIVENGRKEERVNAVQRHHRRRTAQTPSQAR
jgi:hypothetical protein